MVMHVKNRCLIRNVSTEREIIIPISAVFCRDNVSGELKVASENDIKQNTPIYMKSGKLVEEIIMIHYGDSKLNLLKIKRSGAGNRQKLIKRLSFTPSLTKKKKKLIETRKIREEKKLLQHACTAAAQNVNRKILGDLQNITATSSINDRNDDSGADFSQKNQDQSITEKSNDDINSNIIQKENNNHENIAVAPINDEADDDDVFDHVTETEISRITNISATTVTPRYTSSPITPSDRQRNPDRSFQGINRSFTANKSSATPRNTSSLIISSYRQRDPDRSFQSIDKSFVSNKSSFSEDEEYESSSGPVTRSELQRDSERLKNDVLQSIKEIIEGNKRTRSMPNIQHQGKVEILPNVWADAEYILKAANTTKMSIRARNAMRAIWTPAKRDFLVTKITSKTKNMIKVTSEEYNILINICLELQYAKKLISNTSPTDPTAIMRIWVQNFLKNDRRERKQKPKNVNLDARNTSAKSLQLF